MEKLIIAIDGPSGVGKSTLSKLVAKDLGYINLDTGAMYRTVALAAQRRGIDPADNQALGRLCDIIHIDFLREGAAERVLLDGEDVSQAIRTPEISLLTARVAACPEVRHAMVTRQREIGAGGGVVLEGRDIGTVVFPQAQIKVFLAASPEVRGRRRFLELQAQGVHAELARTIAEVEARDLADSSRDAAPLRQAADAVLVDTSHLDIGGVLHRVLDLVRSRLAANSAAGKR